MKHVLASFCEVTGIDQETVISYVEREWIYPCSADLAEFDDEDVARVRLIRELRDDFGANEEAISIILHLLDQVYHLRHQLTCRRSDSRLG